MADQRPQRVFAGGWWGNRKVFKKRLLPPERLSLHHEHGSTLPRFLGRRLVWQRDCGQSTREDQCTQDVGGPEGVHHVAERQYFAKDGEPPVGSAGRSRSLRAGGPDRQRTAGRKYYGANAGPTSLVRIA